MRDAGDGTLIANPGRRRLSYTEWSARDAVTGQFHARVTGHTRRNSSTGAAGEYHVAAAPRAVREIGRM
jgi:hypothetical protein